MKVLAVTTLLAVITARQSDCALLPKSLQHELRVIKGQVVVLDELLASECPEYTKVKRETTEDLTRTEISVLKVLHARLLRKLTKCRQNKARNKSSPAITLKKILITSPVPEKTSKATREKGNPGTITDKAFLTTTTETPTTTIEKSQLGACRTATNLTESWRREHNGAHLKPGGPHSDRGYACDFHKDLQWFRFTGAAGNKMLDTCPKSVYSCGSVIPWWTDAVMPSAVGVVKTVDVFGMNHGCKVHVFPLQVIRCSWDTDYDLIYRQPQYYLDTCIHAFCGTM